jgi:hypothetical protein
LQSFARPNANNIQDILGSPALYFYIIGAVFLLYRTLTILWTMKDITSRTSNILGQILAVLVVWIGTPLVGLPIYLLLRPTRFKRDRLGWREALSVQVASCPACANKNPLHHDFCVYCGQQMTVKCKECKSSYPRSYEYCSQCGAANVD